MKSLRLIALFGLLTTEIPGQQSRVIGFIGDSITNGMGASDPSTTSAPPQEIVALNSHGGSFSFVNDGIDGTSTDDWVSGSTNLNNAITSFTGNGVTAVSIMLGTNDCAIGPGRPHNSAATVQAHLLTTITSLKSHGFNIIVLNSSIYSPDPIIDLPLLLSYNTAFDNLAANDPTHVFVGDQKAYSAFQSNYPAWYSDTIHPNDTGYSQLGQFWATAYRNLFYAASRIRGQATLGGLAILK